MLTLGGAINIFNISVSSRGQRRKTPVIVAAVHEMDYS